MGQDLNRFMWLRGLPRGLSEEAACQCRRSKRPGFAFWIGKILWRRKWQLTSIFLTEKSHRQRSLLGYSSQDHKESDTTKQAHTHVAQKPRILLPPCTISSRVLSSLNLIKHNNVTSIMLLPYSSCKDGYSFSLHVEPGARSHTLFVLSSGQVQSQAQIRNCIFTN